MPNHLLYVFGNVYDNIKMQKICAILIYSAGKPPLEFSRTNYMLSFQLTFYNLEPFFNRSQILLRLITSGIL